MDPSASAYVWTEESIELLCDKIWNQLESGHPAIGLLPKFFMSDEEWSRRYEVFTRDISQFRERNATLLLLFLVSHGRKIT